MQKPGTEYSPVSRTFLARAVAAAPDDFQFDERVLCRAFCLSAKEEILATQWWDTAAAERDTLSAQNRELVEALERLAAHYEIRAEARARNGSLIGASDGTLSASLRNARALLAKHGR